MTDDTGQSIQEAADLLGVSPADVDRLLDDGKLSPYIVGAHPRLRAADVLAYKSRRDARLSGVERAYATLSRCGSGQWCSTSS